MREIAPIASDFLDNYILAEWATTDEIYVQTHRDDTHIGAHPMGDS